MTKEGSPAPHTPRHQRRAVTAAGIVDRVERAANAVVELLLAGELIEQLLRLVIELRDGLEDAIG